MRAALVPLLLAVSAQAQPAPYEAFLSAIDAGHPELRAAAAQRDQAEAQLLARRGVFDPSLNVGLSERRFHSSSAPGKASQAREGEASLDLLTRWGARASVGGRQARGDLKTPVTPTGNDGTVSYSLGVPLLRGAFADPRTAAERRAELGVTGAQARYLERRQRLRLSASEAWWKWAAARRKAAIERELLANAEFRQTAVASRAEHGDLPRVAAVEAEAEVWARRGRVARADRALQQAAISLSNHLWTSAGEPAPLPESDGGDDEESGDPIGESGAAQAVERALSERPELLALAVARETARVDERLARNLLLPQLDAFWSQGQDRGAGGAGDVHRGGLELKIPLFMRSGRGEARNARLTLESLDWLERSLRQRVTNEARDAASAHDAELLRLAAARNEARLAAELEAAERKAYEHGDSTLFLVNTRERATAEARGRLVDALADWRIARVALRAATASL